MEHNIIPYIGGEEEKSEKEPLRLWGKIEDHRNNTSTTRKEDLTHRFYTLMMDNYREHKEVIFYADKLHVSSKYLSSPILTGR